MRGQDAARLDHDDLKDTSPDQTLTVTLLAMDGRPVLSELAGSRQTRGEPSPRGQTTDAHASTQSCPS